MICRKREKRNVYEGTGDSVDAAKGVQIQNRELGLRVSSSTEAREVRTAAMGEVQRKTNINKEKRKKQGLWEFKVEVRE